jgi:hypothetical protein
LSAGKQERIYHEVRAHLKSPQPQGRRRGKRTRRLDPREERELWMALASFERLGADIKVKLGRQLLQQLGKATPHPQELWALSRLGGRKTIYGSLDEVIPSAEAAAWVETLLSRDLDRQEGVAHALVNLARYTGDRARDVPDMLRNRVLAWLADLPEGEHFQDRLMNPDSAYNEEEQDWMFGEALPVGLILASPVSS